MSNTKEKYRKYCAENEMLPIFFQPWWLDVVSGTDEWNVVVIEKDDVLQACLPYIIKKRKGLTSLGMPLLTPYLGPWINYNNDQKEAARISTEKKLFTELIEQLPRFDKFHIQFNHTITNWLPFYWKGFRETTLYTYVIEDLKMLDAVKSNLAANIKSDIVKAEKKVTIERSNDVEALFDTCVLTFKRQHIDVPFDLKTIQHIHRATTQNEAGQIFLARDEESRVHAGAFIVWDKNRAYYLMGGGDPELRNSGATSLLLWEAIQFAATVAEKFDFEGSMIQPVEKFFRAFGADQKPYFLITKTNSKLVRAVQLFQDLLR